MVLELRAPAHAVSRVFVLGSGKSVRAGIDLFSAAENGEVRPMAHPKAVRFYFDFISPYSYLASQLIAREATLRSIAFESCPIAFGRLLAARKTPPPGEIPVRRRHALQDVLLLAQCYGLPFECPPAHPFNSLYALRSVAGVANGQQRSGLATRYFARAWGEGRSLESLAVLRETLAELGIAQDPEEAATDRSNRETVRSFTEQALAAGVFGVPSFVVDGLVFFGHDRLDLLRAYLAGECQFDPALCSALLERPQPGRIAQG